MKITWYDGAEITGATPEQLKTAVNAMIADGWEWIRFDLDEGTATLRLASLTMDGEVDP